jgi:hypothetical protein
MSNLMAKIQCFIKQLLCLCRRPEIPSLIVYEFYLARWRPAGVDRDAPKEHSRALRNSPYSPVITLSAVLENLRLSRSM